jgi:hypothetical protein
MVGYHEVLLISSCVTRFARREVELNKAPTCRVRYSIDPGMVHLDRNI